MWVLSRAVQNLAAWVHKGFGEPSFAFCVYAFGLVLGKLKDEVGNALSRSISRVTEKSIKSSYNQKWKNVKIVFAVIG